MQRLNADEMKWIQLNILDHIAEFCDKNKINYWIDTGTLLGAIRHKGFIPWDDDIDIGMLRSDYDRFINLYKNTGKYKFYCVENNKRYSYPFGKVMDSDTVLYEPDKKGYKIAVYIDVFVYDNAPEDDSEVDNMYKKRDFYRYLRDQRMSRVHAGNKMRQFLVSIFWNLVKIIPGHFFCKLIVYNSRKYSKYETRRVGNFTSDSKIIVDKSVFHEFIKVEFEGKYYNAPIGYDMWLKAFYGDYMKLPPEEKRISKHIYEAYKNENKE